MRKMIFISGLVLLLDFFSKQLVLHFLIEDQSIVVIPNFFSITLAKNTGVAFSMLDGKVPFIIMMTLFVIILLIQYISHSTKGKLENICYALIIGGAIGNLLDRIVYGYVVDFLDFYLFGYHYPIFNLADSFIVIGVCLLLIVSFKERGKNI